MTLHSQVPQSPHAMQEKTYEHDPHAIVTATILFTHLHFLEIGKFKMTC